MAHKCKICGKPFRKTDYRLQHEKDAHPPEPQRHDGPVWNLRIARSSVVDQTMAVHLAEDWGELFMSLAQTAPSSPDRK